MLGRLEISSDGRSWIVSAGPAVRTVAVDWYEFRSSGLLIVSSETRGLSSLGRSTAAGTVGIGPLLGFGLLLWDIMACIWRLKLRAGARLTRPERDERDKR